MRKITLLFSLFLSFNLSLNAQAVPGQSALTIEQIMQGEKFVGFLPSNIHWSDDSKTIYFSWNPEMDTLRSIYKVGLNGGSPSKLTEEELREKPGRFGSFNKARDKKLYSKNGDIYLLEIPSGRKLQVTNTLDRESNPVFSGDETKVVYTKANNLFVWDIKAGTTTQLSNFKKGTKKEDAKAKENEAWLERDQLEYFQILKQRKDTREADERRDEGLEPDRPLEIYLGNNNVFNIKASPDLKFITYTLSSLAGGKRTKVPNYVTESGYIDNLNARVKVGSSQANTKFGLYDIAKDSAFVIDTKQIKGIYNKPAYYKDYHEGEEAYKDQFEKPRAVNIMGPVYSDDGSKAMVVVLSRDNKDRWIMLLDLPSRALKLLDHQHDDAWVGGPGIGGWNFTTGNVGWLGDNESIYFHSEETGFSQLYTMNVRTGKKKALTQGKFEILSAELSLDKEKFYISSNMESPHEQHFYLLPVKGGKMKKLSKLPGNNAVSLSPDEKYMAIRYSYSNKPWELYLMPNEEGASAKQITHSTTSEFKKYKWREPEIIRFTASDGVKVPARLYRPANAQPNGPAVIFVHGAGYLQNVHRWWSSYYREYMFHNILTDNGYTVLDIDYRASNGYGRDWRTAIYRFMGGKDLDDQVDGAKYLVEALKVDPKRIGIYGGSYGGFITLMAQFTKPGVFKCGAALRSVTDWAHYNHGYTSNILNTPVLDSIAYYKSSPIYHAEGLQDHLLILHGMIDTNVQFQDVVRLAQRLIELGKDNWEFAVFPLEGHGFVESSSWADEYKRIYKLFQTHLSDPPIEKK